MFVLKQHHLDALAQVARESFEDRMAVMLRQRFAGQCDELGEDGLRERIADGIDRASGYDITAEQDVATFLRYMFGLRPDFDTARETAYAGKILREKDATAADRLARIKTAAREQRTRAREEKS